MISFKAAYLPKGPPIGFGWVMQGWVYHKGWVGHTGWGGSYRGGVGHAVVGGVGWVM